MSFIHLISYVIKGRSMKSLIDIKVDYLTARERRLSKTNGLMIFKLEMLTLWGSSLIYILWTKYVLWNQ